MTKMAQIKEQSKRSRLLCDKSKDLGFSPREDRSAWASVPEPHCEKTGLRGFRPGPTQTGLYSHRRWLEA